MKINQIASKPKLIKLIVDDEETLGEFGEEVEFYTWDRQPLETFMKVASTSQENPNGIIEIASELILDEEGKQVIQDDVTVPNKLLIKMVEKVISTLGK